jgi:hypothetical protein
MARGTHSTTHERLARQEISYHFFFGETDAVRIDTENIVEICEK